jgi:hypothetical protein
MATRKCVVCNSSFSPRGRNHKSCSEDCARLNRDAVKRAWTKKPKGQLFYRKRDLSKVGCTPAQWQEALERQGNRCGITDKPFPPDTSWDNCPRNVFSDHCHNTGNFRGPLTPWANQVMHVIDDLDMFKRCATWAIRFNPGHRDLLVGWLLSDEVNGIINVAANGSQEAA